MREEAPDAAGSRPGIGSRRPRSRRHEFRHPTRRAARATVGIAIFPIGCRQLPRFQARGPMPHPSLRLGEGLGVHLVQDLELGDLGLDEVLAVAFAFDLGGLLDPVEVLVVLEGRLLGELLALEADHLGHHLDGQAALLVEVEREVLAVRAGHLDDGGRLVADLLLARGLDLEALLLEREEPGRGRPGDRRLRFSLARASSSMSILSPNIRQPLSPFRTMTPLNSLLAEFALDLDAIVIEALSGRMDA